MIRLPIPTTAELLAEAWTDVARYRATNPRYDDPMGVELDERAERARDRFFANGGTIEQSDAIEDAAFAPFDNDPIDDPDDIAFVPSSMCTLGRPAAADALTFDECEAAGVDGTGRFIG